jgi:hypothetical protein
MTRAPLIVIGWSGASEASDAINQSGQFCFTFKVDCWGKGLRPGSVSNIWGFWISRRIVIIGLSGASDAINILWSNFVTSVSNSVLKIQYRYFKNVKYQYWVFFHEIYFCWLLSTAVLFSVTLCLLGRSAPTTFHIVCVDDFSSVY